MAEIVLGIGTSHSPQMSTPAELWALHAERDRAMDGLYYRGRAHTFAELEERMRTDVPDLEQRLAPAAWEEGFRRCQEATTRLRAAFLEADPDVVVILANDHRELFRSNLPAIAIPWMDVITNVPVPLDEVPESIRPALSARQKDVAEDYPCHSELGLHLIGSLTAGGFDITEISRQPPDGTIGHGFSHVRLLIMNELRPMVPVIMNSYYPPNQPTARRCHELGQAIGDAIEAWDADARVCVVASGGLSHFVVDREFDEALLAALAAADADHLRGIRDDELMQGTAECRHWVAAGGALRDLDMQVVDYVPAYRSAAGTGCGMAYTLWS